MATPPPPTAVPTSPPSNPIEGFFGSFNTNTYFIGLMMILLNLGGRHLATSLTPDQDKAFQHPWIRRALLFVVIFVATRNVFTAFWMSISIILLLGYLGNESSRLYMFGTPKDPQPLQASPEGLNAEENEIFKKLQEKSKIYEEHFKKKGVPEPPYREIFTNSYVAAMSSLP
jgi:hypothetical protein